MKLFDNTEGPVKSLFAVVAGLATTEIITQMGASLIQLLTTVLSFIAVEWLRRKYFKDNKPKPPSNGNA